MKKTDVTIIIVSLNAKEYLKKTLDAVFASQTPLQYKVVVVENNSQDESYSMLKNDYPQVHTIRLEEKTVGFSEANILGAKEANGEFLFFLNPDTEISANTLDVLCKSLHDHPEIGAVSGKLLNSDNSYQFQGGALPSLWNVFGWMFFLDDLPILSLLFHSYQQKQEPPTALTYQGWIGGTAIMISSALYEKIGGWNSDIFLYGEDVELCLRIQKAGKTCAVSSETTIIHHQQKSVKTKTTSYIGEFRGLVYIWKTQFPSYQLPILRVLLFTGAWLRVVLFGILFNDEEKRHAYFEAQKIALLA